MISIESTRTMSAAEAGDALSAEVRQCGDCGEGRLKCTKVLEERKNGFYVGRTYEFACTGCSVQLERYDGWMAFKRIFMQILIAPMLGVMMLSMALSAASTGWMLGIGAIGFVVLASGLYTGMLEVRYRRLLFRSPVL